MPEGIAARIRRGIALYAERGHEITKDGEAYLVPCCSGSGKYRVTITEDGAECRCPDRCRSGLSLCKHGAAAMIADAKAPRVTLVTAAHEEAARLGRPVRAAGQVFHPPVTPEKRRERVRLAKAFLASFDVRRTA